MSTYTAMHRILDGKGATPAQITLMDNIMQVESGGSATARNAKSSATGYFQFIDDTFLQMMQAHGAEHGYGRYADAIYRGSDGRMQVRDGLREEVLALRSDLKAATLMMQEFTEENRQKLRAETGREPNAGALYLAHFAGAEGAIKVLKAADDTPIKELIPAAMGPNAGIKMMKKGAQGEKKELKFAHFTAANLRQWAAGKMDVDVPARVEFDRRMKAGGAEKPTQEEIDDELNLRRRLLAEFGIDEDMAKVLGFVKDEDLLGVAFMVALLKFVGEAVMADQAQAEAAPALPEQRRADADPAMDPGLAAAALAAAPQTAVTLTDRAPSLPGGIALVAKAVPDVVLTGRG